MSRLSLRRDPANEQRTSNLELFYDLVFVFTITQVSHLLLPHPSWDGAGRAALVLLVVWWAWQFTVWMVNELDPEAVPLRLLMFALMLASMLMAIAIPEAFGDKALLFAGSYVAIQVGRTAFLAFAAAAAGSLERIRANQILAWFCVAGVVWIAGALASDRVRIVMWIVALAIDYAGPLVTFRVPGRQRVTADAWEVGTSHFTERFSLFVIIALGESIVLIGGTTAELPLDTARVAAFVGAFLGTAALWWLYFTSVAERAERALAASANRTLLARDAYTYGHALIVAGIILTAVGSELVIAHPGDELDRAALIAVVAGPAFYLLAQLFLRLRMTGVLSVRRATGILGCVAVGLIGAAVPALVVGLLLLGVLVGLIASDTIVGNRRAAIPGSAG